MLKMYQQQKHAGSSPDFWEENWAASQFEEAVQFCASDPLRPLFEKYLTPNAVVLEGGCGLGNYVTYYSERGYRVIGLDFAQQALQTLRTRQPNLTLCGGDVARLPFADKSFDLYYSGGVVEHFEGGAESALREAHRVLKDDGVLLISVPYFNPLRRFLSRFRKGDWKIVNAPQGDDGSGIRGKAFFQYAYTVGEFEKMLDDAGLRVTRKQGYAVIWGLRELPFLKLGAEEFSNHATGHVERESPRPVDVSELVKDQPASLLKRLVVHEDASVPVFGLGVKLMRWAAANMMMYVCERR
jgi:SAM-dependent methyltransferase